MEFKKIATLINWYENNVDINAEEINFIDNIVEIDGSEYLILDDEEATEMAEQQIRNITEAMGIEAFSEGFQGYIYNNCILPTDIFDTIVEEYYQFYIDDIKEEEGRLEEEMEYYNVDNEKDLLEKLVESTGDPIEYLKDNFGSEFVEDTIREYNLLDWDAIIDECIEVDGRGHFISSYDGQEIEENGYFIYRIN